MEPLYNQIYQGVIEGNATQVKEKIEAALYNGLAVEDILNNGLIAAMREVGQLFEIGEYFVPEMLISTRAMQAGMSIIRPRLIEKDIKPHGKVVIGTVKGDLHDIGKNLVSMMLEGGGFEVIDLGTDVTPEKFIEVIHTQKPDIVGMSALLTTTMANIAVTIKSIEQAGLIDTIKIMVGGAPVTQHFAAEVGSHGYAPDASQAVAVARQLMRD